MVGVMKIMLTPSKGLVQALLYSVALTQQQATADSRLYWRLLDTPNLAEFLRVRKLGEAWFGYLAQGPS